MRGVYRLDFVKGVSYIAHADPSGGARDAFTMAIGHVEGDIGILGVLLEKRPPFASGIDDVVLEFCAVLTEYGLHECVGDRYAAGFTIEAFRKHGVEYRHSDMTTSDYFSGFLPILNSRSAQLLDHKRLAAQLCSLERRPSRIGAKDSISHPFGGHDDCAAAVAGLMVRLVGTVVHKGPVARVGTFRVGMYDGIVEPDWFARGDRFPPADQRAGMETNTIIHDHNAMKKANLDEYFG